MALVVKDRVRETSTTGGTGPVALNGAVQAFQDFTVIGDGNTTYYTIVDAQTGDWEVGIGTYTLATTTLSRDTVLESSNLGNLVNFTTNVKDVFVTYPAERSVYTEGSAIVPATTSRLGFANITQGDALSVLGVNGNAQADLASISAGSDYQVLRRSGTSIGFGAIALNQSGAVTGTLQVGNGGTGATTLTGYVIGNGTGAFTASATIPNTNITGLGTMSTQNANTVAITGGSINGTTVGASTPSTGAFTNFSASGTAAFTSTAAVTIPVGTQAERPTPAAGMLRFNTDTDEFEGYNGTAWASVGGSAISNDTATATDLYPTFVNATTGTALNIYTSNAKLLYKPSTGELKSQQLVATNGIVVNNATISANYTVAAGNNAMSVGPLTVDAVVTVDGGIWLIL